MAERGASTATAVECLNIGAFGTLCILLPLIKRMLDHRLSTALPDLIGQILIVGSCMGLMTAIKKGNIYAAAAAAAWLFFITLYAASTHAYGWAAVMALGFLAALLGVFGAWELRRTRHSN